MYTEPSRDEVVTISIVKFVGWKQRTGVVRFEGDVFEGRLVVASENGDTFPAHDI
jgi:hypothetical protein